MMQKRSAKTFRRVGYISIPIGILGYMIIVPPLLTPLNPPKNFWFWYNVRTIVALIFSCLGIVGFLSLFWGLVCEIPWVKRILESQSKGKV